MHSHMLAKIIVPAEVFPTARIRAFVRCFDNDKTWYVRAKKENRRTFLIRVDAAHMPFEVLSPGETLAATGNIAGV